MDKLKSKLKGKAKEGSQTAPSSNWAALQKKVSSLTSKGSTSKRARKKRRIEGPSAAHIGDGTDGTESSRGRNRALSVDSDTSTTFPRGAGQEEGSEGPEASTSYAGGGKKESIDYLRKMVLGQIMYSESQKQPGRYLALDCEMVGVGPNGSESSLARVSLVNYHGAVILDEFVRQRERVTDYRTFVSGIRETDMINAKSFVQVQKTVADLLKDRILVGHALYNDTKALMLSHPRPLIRDTQTCAGKHKVLNTKNPALRKLVQHELGIEIQGGEHSSVIDARATMAIYRIHRKEWDKDFRPLPVALTSSKKRKAPDDQEDEPHEGVANNEAPHKLSKNSKATKQFPGGGRKGVSSGLSTIVKRSGQQSKKSSSHPSENNSKEKWWTSLNPMPSKGAKGSIRISSK